MPHFGSSVFVVLLTTTSLFSCAPAKSPAPDVKISVSPPSLDFGSVGYGANIPLTVTVSNPGSVVLSVQSEAIIDDSGFVYSVKNAPITIAVGASSVFTVTMVAPTVPGTYLSSLVITSNALDDGEVSVPLAVVVNAPPDAGTDAG